MRKTIVFSAIAMFVATQYAFAGPIWTKEPTSFRGIPFGASVAETKKKLNKHRCESNEKKGETSCFERDYKIGRAIIDGSIYTFRNNKLVSIYMSIKSSDYEYIKELFVKKYGDPLETISMEERKRGNFILIMKNNTFWNGKNVGLVISKYAGDSLVEGCITYSLQDYVATQAIERKTEEEKEKNDALKNL